MAYKDKEKNREYNKQYRLTHVDQIKESSKRYRITHADAIKEKQKEYQRQYWLTHKEKLSDYSKQYHLSHRKEILEKMKKYRLGHIEETKENYKQYYSVNSTEIKERHKQLYHTRKAQGLCVCCGEEAIPGMSMCIRHVIAGNLKQREYIATHAEELKKKYSARRKLWRETRRCTSCGTPLDEDDGTKCCNCSCGISMRRRDYNRAFNISKIARRS